TPAVPHRSWRCVVSTRTRSPRGSKLGSVPFVALILLSIGLAACGNSTTQAKRNGPPKPLVIVPNTGGDLVQDFNPFQNGAINSYGQFGPVYEPLLFFNRADGSIKPWLASSYSYSSDATQLTFKLRPGVQWSDGQAFTASDVVYTLKAIKQYSDADYLGIADSIKDV